MTIYVVCALVTLIAIWLQIRPRTVTYVTNVTNISDKDPDRWIEDLNKNLGTPRKE